MSTDPLSATFGSLTRLAPAEERAEAERTRLDEMRRMATEFEAVFLSQMLDHAGLGRTPEGFGGGAGEEAFRGHLIAEQARLMASRGGIGLADTVFRAMVEREGLDP
jgi:Rod binding domain-containing protein